MKKLLIGCIVFLSLTGCSFGVFHIGVGERCLQIDKNGNPIEGYEVDTDAEVKVDENGNPVIG